MRWVIKKWKTARSLTAKEVTERITDVEMNALRPRCLVRSPLSQSRGKFLESFSKVEFLKTRTLQNSDFRATPSLRPCPCPGQFKKLVTKEKKRLLSEQSSRHNSDSSFASYLCWWNWTINPHLTISIFPVYLKGCQLQRFMTWRKTEWLVKSTCRKVNWLGIYPSPFLATKICTMTLWKIFFICLLFYLLWLFLLHSPLLRLVWWAM